MHIRDTDNIRPNYFIEAAAVTVIALCIGLNLFSDNLGFTNRDSAAKDFQGFKMVNVKNHQVASND